VNTRRNRGQAIPTTLRTFAQTVRSCHPRFPLPRRPCYIADGFTVEEFPIGAARLPTVRPRRHNGAARFPMVGPFLSPPPGQYRAPRALSFLSPPAFSSPALRRPTSVGVRCHGAHVPSVPVHLFVWGKSAARPSLRRAIGRVCGWIRVPTASGFAVRTSRDSIESRVSVRSRGPPGVPDPVPGFGTRPEVPLMWRP
jgi:hypothetical protein